jgi:hypothetical protein
LIAALSGSEKFRKKHGIHSRRRSRVGSRSLAGGYQLSTIHYQLFPNIDCAYRGSMISSPPLNENNTTWVHLKSGGKPKSQSTNAKSG